MEEEKIKILDETNKHNKIKSNLERHRNELLYNKNLLLLQKDKNVKERIDIQRKITDINNQILFIVIKLQSVYEIITDIVMNNTHFINEEEYIDVLMDKINIKEEDKIAKIKKIKESYNIFKNTVKMDINELIKLDDLQ